MTPPGTSEFSRRRQLREECVKTFYGLTRTARIHQANNQLIVQAAKAFVRTVVLLSKDAGDVPIQFMGRRIYVQEKKLIYRPETVSLFDSIIDYFEKRALQGLRFYPSIKEIRGAELLEFIRLLNEAERYDRPEERLLSETASGRYPWVELLQKATDTESAQEDTRKNRGLKSYAHVLGSVQEIATKLTTKRNAGLNRTRRVLQNMVDLIMEDEPLFRALSTIRFYDDYTFGHSVNVAILSMCIGKRIMLSKKSLETLGLCGLLHDLGKIEIPKEILNKPGKLTEEEFTVMKQHSLDSVRLIVKIQASRDRKNDILLAPFEHHLKYDLSGYPKTDRSNRLSLFGRILTIADVYDAITSPRVYRKSVLPPNRALGFMWEKVGQDFDPILLKVFINMLGVYPVGTLLVLDNRKAGLVVEPPEGADGPLEWSRPWVVLLKRNGDNGRKKFVKGDTVNLAEKDPGSGRYRYSIIKSLNAANYGIQPIDFFE
jgi:HD-GYP domain-containing protein (c-di-GMP phosphodiesterase class II)